MRKGKWQKIALGLALAAALGLTACGSPSDMMASDTMLGGSSGGTMNGAAAYDKGSGFAVSEAWADSEMAYVSEEAAMDPAGSQIVDNSAYYSDRKLIKTVNLDVETQEFDLMVSALEEQVNLLGGYIEDMYSFNGSKYNAYHEPVRNASMTVRIPKQQLSVFLDTVSDIGNVISRSENVKDVTLDYVDVESHRDALRMEQERLMALLEQAETMEDILTIEDRLSYLRYQLDSMESQLRTYDNKVDFSTVYLTIHEVKELTPIEEETVWERIANGFMDNLRDVGEGLLDFVIWFVVHIPSLLVWAIIIAVIVLIIKKIRRNRKTKKAAKASQAMQMNQPVQPNQPMQAGQPNANQAPDAGGRTENPN